SAISGTGLGIPVPVRLTICGLPGASSVTARSPFRVPSAVGVKVTLMVQLAPAFTELPQLLFSAKSPLVAMLVMVRVALPLLVRVTVWGLLVVPTLWLPKARLVGDRVTAGPAPLTTWKRGCE